MLQLVGHDPHGHAARRQLVERGQRTGKGRGVNGEMAFIIVEQPAMQQVEGFRIISPRGVESVAKHRPRAATDHRLDRLDAQRRSPDRGQRMVDRRRQIAAGIQQRAVQVEADDGKGETVW